MSKSVDENLEAMKVAVMYNIDWSVGAEAKTKAMVDGWKLHLDFYIAGAMGPISYKSKLFIQV